MPDFKAKMRKNPISVRFLGFLNFHIFFSENGNFKLFFKLAWLNQ